MLDLMPKKSRCTVSKSDRVLRSHSHKMADQNIEGMEHEGEENQDLQQDQSGSQEDVHSDQPNNVEEQEDTSETSQNVHVENPAGNQTSQSSQYTIDLGQGPIPVTFQELMARPSTVRK